MLFNVKGVKSHIIYNKKVYLAPYKNINEIVKYWVKFIFFLMMVMYKKNGFF